MDSPYRRRMSVALPIAVCALILVCPHLAHAATTGGMPWDSAGSKFITDLTGPVAFLIGIVMIVGAGATLIMAQEIGMFMRVMMMVIFALGLIVDAPTIISYLYGISGALIR